MDRVYGEGEVICIEVEFAAAVNVTRTQSPEVQGVLIGVVAGLKGLSWCCTEFVCEPSSIL